MKIEGGNNIITGVSTNILGTLVMFLTTIYLTRSFDTQVYGEFRLAFTFVSLIVTLFIFGRDNGVVYFTQGKKEAEKDKIIAQETLYALLSLLLGAILLFILGKPITKFLFGDNLKLEHYWMALPMIPLWGYFNAGVAGLRAKSRINSSFTLTNFTQRLLRALFFLIFAFVCQTFESLAWAMLSSQVVLIVLLLHKLPSLLQIFNQSMKDFMVRFRYSLQLGFSAIIFVVLSRLDIIMLGSLSNNINVAVYDVCVLLSFVILFPYNALVKTVEPEVKLMLVEPGILEKYRNNLKLAIVLSLFVVIPFLIAPETVLGIFGQDYTMGSRALVVLSLGYALMIFLGSPIEILNMIGSVRVSLIILIFCIAINILLNFLLIPYFATLGAAIATMATLIISRLFANYYLKKMHDISLVRVSHLKFLILMIAVVVLFLGIKFFLFEISGYLSTGIFVFLSVSLYGILLLLIDRNLREKTIIFFKRLKKQ